jgi:hypothetical protein
MIQHIYRYASILFILTAYLISLAVPLSLHVYVHIVYVDGCGPLVHSLITHRAQQHLLQLLLDNDTIPHIPVIDRKYHILFDIPSDNTTVTAGTATATDSSKYIHSIVSGSSFPDYLYHCASDHAAGEVTHWSIFQVESIRYIHDRYEYILKNSNTSLSDINNDTYKDDKVKLYHLLAFMLGIVSHSQSDIEWHGLHGNVNALPRGYGLIQYICAVDYDYTDGSLCDEGHSIADLGGEFVAAVNTNVSNPSWFQPDQWVLPTDDLIAIYQRLNHTVTSTTLSLCRLEFIAMSLGVQQFGHMLYNRMTDASPTLVEKFLDLSTGGIDDMSIQVIQSWKRYLQWLEYGIPDVLPDNWRPDTHTYRLDSNDINKNENENKNRVPPEERYMKYRQHKSELYSKLTELSLPIRNSAAWQQYINGHIDKNQLIESIPSTLYYDKLQQEIDHHDYGARFAVQSRSMSHNEVTLMGVDNHATTSSMRQQVNQSRVHHVYLINGNNVTVSSANGSNQLNSVLYQQWSYYGASISRGNMDGQGISTFVCSYGSGLQSGICESQVDRNNITYLHSYMQGDAFARYGYQQVSVDVDLDGYDDWIVSAPFGGSSKHGIFNETDVAYNYYGSLLITYGDDAFFTSSHTPRLAYNKSAEIMQQYATVLLAADVNADGHNDLIIGSPYSRNIDNDAHEDLLAAYRGRIDVSIANSQSNKNGIHHDITIISDDTYSQFGCSAVAIHVDNDPNNPYTLLLVSSPTYKYNGTSAVGRLAAYRINNDTRGVLNYRDTVFTITGDVNDPHSKFGFNLAYSKNHQILAVAAISASNGNDSGKHSGKVYLVSNVHTLRGDVFINNTDLQATLIHPSSGARFGWNIEFVDVQHITAQPQSQSEHVLVITAPLYSISTNETQHGSVLIYRDIEALRGMNLNAVTTASHVEVGRQVNGRFGSTILLEENAEYSWLNVAAPHASQYQMDPLRGLECIDMMGEVDNVFFTNSSSI